MAEKKARVAFDDVEAPLGRPISRAVEAGHRRAAVIDSDLADTEDCTSFVRTRLPRPLERQGTRIAPRGPSLAREQA